MFSTIYGAGVVIWIFFLRSCDCFVKSTCRFPLEIKKQKKCREYTNLLKFPLGEKQDSFLEGADEIDYESEFRNLFGPRKRVRSDNDIPEDDSTVLMDMFDDSVRDPDGSKLKDKLESQSKFDFESLNSDSNSKNDIGDFFKGGIFPQSSGRSASTNGSVRIIGNRIEPGNPSEMVGFWQVYSDFNTGEFDPSDRMVLRADGLVVGGPMVDKGAVTTWSDPTGSRPFSGQWTVYGDTREGKMGTSRLKITLITDRSGKSSIEMDGLLIMTSEYDEYTQNTVSIPQAFGRVVKRTISDGSYVENSSHEFSMYRVNTNGIKLQAEIGSQGPRRLW